MTPVVLMTFDRLRYLNTERARDIFPHGEQWSEMEWGCAIAGEVGEMCNMLQKRAGPLPVSDSAIANEMADAIIFIDRLAERMGIDLGREVARKFDIVSSRHGWDGPRMWDTSSP